jgi:lipoprotein-anchoring transpeptidase ErfK/SrfK
MIMRRAALISAGVLGGVLWVVAATAAPLPVPSFGQYVAQAAAEPDAALAPDLRRQLVDYPAQAEPGTVIVDTTNTHLYFILGGGKAIRYGIGVGRDGFGWSGTQSVTRKAEWPDWTPPQEMIARQPYLARWMAGGEGNPLGARAIYLGSTIYRIHGTNMPDTIGQKVSSGCIRMLNADVIDLYARVSVGTKIIVLGDHSLVAAAAVPVVPGRQFALPASGLLPSAIY